MRITRLITIAVCGILAAIAAAGIWREWAGDETLYKFYLRDLAVTVWSDPIRERVQIVRGWPSDVPDRKLLIVDSSWAEQPLLWIASDVQMYEHGHTGPFVIHLLHIGVARYLLILGPITVLCGLVFWRLIYPRWVRSHRLAKGKCLTCGYDLRGLHSTKCPECGSAFDQQPTPTPQ